MDEKCIVCGEFSQYCLGGHGEPCEHCRGYALEGGGEWHEIDCILVDHKPQPKFFENYGIMVSAWNEDGYRWLTAGQARDLEEQVHAWLCTSDDLTAELEALQYEPDPYPDFVSNGHGGWSRA